MTGVVSAAVAVLLAASIVVNWTGLAAMAGMGLRAFWRAPKGERKAAVVGAVRSRHFWWAYWYSFAALVVNTCAPLLLVPFAPVAGWSLFTVNAAFNVVAIPIRGSILWATMRARAA